VIRSLVLPSCPSCSSTIIKPQVVFFGDNVPTKRQELVTSMLSQSDGVLVVGSSLQTFSIYKFILRWLKNEYSITSPNNHLMVINRHPTRICERHCKEKCEIGHCIQDVDCEELFVNCLDEVLK